MPAAKAERQRQAQRNSRDQNQECLADDIAQAELVERDQNDEHEDRVHRQAAQQRCVPVADVAQVGRDGHADESREVRAKRKQQHGDHHARNKQQYAPDQLGDVFEVEAVEGDHQRGEDDQPVHQQRKNRDGVQASPSLAQEAVDARLLAEHVEVRRAQRAVEGEARRFGEQPPDQQDRQRQHQARKERANLIKESAERLEQHVDFLHLASRPARYGKARSSTRPASGIAVHSGRWVISYLSS
jgi:hypothetical protein